MFPLDSYIGLLETLWKALANKCFKTVYPQVFKIDKINMLIFEFLFPREFDVLLDDYHLLKYFRDIDKDCSMKVIQLEVTLGVGITSRKSWTRNRRLDTAVIAMVESGKQIL